MIAVLAALLVVPALAQDVTAERRRLQEELHKQAQKNTWAGAETTYGRLLDLALPLSAQAHLIGAQAALENGDATLALLRVRRMQEPADNADSTTAQAWREGQELLASLERGYGRVSIYVPDDRLSVLGRPEMPFAKTERDAIARAREHLLQQRGYRGLLPAGFYSVDGHGFTVVAGADWRVVVVGDEATADVTPPPEP